MNTRAATETSFWFKYLIIGLCTTGYGLWGAKDALFTGPLRAQQAKVWEPLLTDDSLSEEQRNEQWREIAAQRNWALNRPKSNITEKDAREFIIFNYAIMIICGLIGIPCLLWCLMTRGAWIESNEDGLDNSSGQALKLDQITKIDKAKWDKKGIAVIHYGDKDGEQKFIIDDLKFQRQATDSILAWVEDNVDQSLIVNGRTETEIASDKAARRATQEQD